MHTDWGAIITAIGTLLGTLGVIYNTFCNNKKDTFTTSLNELRSEIDQKQQDAEIYREKWLKAEQDNDTLREEVVRLQIKVEKLNKEENNNDNETNC